MGGTVVIIIVLLLAPVFILMSSTFAAWALGSLINSDVDASHEGSELLQLAETNSSLLE